MIFLHNWRTPRTPKAPGSPPHPIHNRQNQYGYQPSDHHPRHKTWEAIVFLQKLIQKIINFFHQPEPEPEPEP
ncbi:MAG: hypothetical protein AAF317_21165, partial [Pseudomonadota bacterium]